MRFAMSAAIALAGAVIGSGAQAADPMQAERGNGIYYNRPGASVADLDRDGKRCGELAAKTVPTHRAAGGGLMGALVSGFADGMRKGAERRRNFETCMVVAGWREVVLTAAEAEALKAAVAKDRDAALAPLVGAATIATGKLGRVWANDFAEPGVEAAAS